MSLIYLNRRANLGRIPLTFGNILRYPVASSDRRRGSRRRMPRI